MCQGGLDAALSPRQVLAIKKEVNPEELDFLLRFPSKTGITCPLDFLQPQGWGGIKVGPRHPHFTGHPWQPGDASRTPDMVVPDGGTVWQPAWAGGAGPRDLSGPGCSTAPSPRVHGSLGAPQPGDPRGQAEPRSDFTLLCGT